jgi:hypothetical protein
MLDFINFAKGIGVAGVIAAAPNPRKRINCEVSFFKVDELELMHIA